MLRCSCSRNTNNSHVTFGGCFIEPYYNCTIREARLVTLAGFGQREAEDIRGAKKYILLITARLSLRPYKV
jgi:hypothetical protein